MRFLGVMFEVAGGYRPIAQLRDLCRRDRFHDICAEITGQHPTRPSHRSRAGGLVPKAALVGGARVLASGPRAPARSAVAPPRNPRLDTRSPGRGPDQSRVGVRRLHICDVNDDVAEVSLVLARGTQAWAVAARMERVNGRWLCAYLEII